MGLKDNKGITLVEIIVSIAILGIIVTPLSSLFVTTVRNNSMARDKMIANQLAQKYMEKVMLDVKKDGSIPLDFSTEESGFYITADIDANESYVVSNTSGSSNIENCNASIKASTSLSDKDEIIVKDNKIKHKGAILGNYTDAAIDIKIKITSIDSLDISIDVVNQSGKQLDIYKVYDKEDEGKLNIISKEGEVNIHENIIEDSDGSTDENRNYLCKIIITVKKDEDSETLAELASYKTND